MTTTLDNGSKLYGRAEIGYVSGDGGRGIQKRDRVIIHTGVSGTGGGSVSKELGICRAYESWHLKRNFNGIGYSFLVGDSGTAYEGRGWGQDGAHTQNGGNRLGHAICFIGDGTKAPPSDAAWSAAAALIRAGQKSGYVTADYRLSGHRDWWPKACPGDEIYDRMHAELGPDRVNDSQPIAKEWDEMATKAEIQQVVREELHRALNSTANAVKIGDHYYPIANDIAGMAINAKAAKELARGARDAAVEARDAASQ